MQSGQIQSYRTSHLFLMRSFTPPLHLPSLEGLRGRRSEQQGPGQHSLQTQTEVYG